MPKPRKFPINFGRIGVNAVDKIIFDWGWLFREQPVSDFHLIIAGDGIRSDLRAMADHVNAEGSRSRLSLVEVQMW